MANTFASFISTTIPAGLRKLATHTVLTRLLKPRSLLRQCGKQNNFTVTRVRKTSGGVAQLVALPQGPPEDASVWDRRKPGSKSRIRKRRYYTPESKHRKSKRTQEWQLQVGRPETHMHRAAFLAAEKMDLMIPLRYLALPEALKIAVRPSN